MAKKKPVIRLTDQEVIESAKSLASSKGYPYSYSEFNCSVAYALQALHDKGITKKQIKLFQKTVNELPVRGGRFNPYSGD